MTAGREGPPRVVVVVGNPKPSSRTWYAAHQLVREVFGAVPTAAFDLTTFGGELLDQDSDAVLEAVHAVRGCDVVVFATPTYKATYTGLLKLFLERFARHSLSGVTAIPLMLAALPEHALAGESHLKPVLAELGLSCPTPACFLLEADVERDGALDVWHAIARPALRHLTGVSA